MATIPSTVDAPVVANQLISDFRTASALNRVQLLEQVDTSPAVDPAAAVALLRDALHDEDPLVREAALRALTVRDTTQAPLLSEADVEGFQGESAELARVHFAARNGDTDSLNDLMRNGDAVVQQGAFDALAATDLPRAVEALLAELRDTTSPYRLQTLQLLAGSSYAHAGEQLLPVLHELAEDTDPLVRAFAVQTLEAKSRETAEIEARN